MGSSLRAKKRVSERRYIGLTVNTIHMRVTLQDQLS